ncbi:uncharacterized protein LOC105249228 isoform X2 [Camponotus floridanus]|uniref:uncharacterized protein LOC105249228 isoform X2 n=1 Tax=Camponotus floridanus TaxID=104421 RepID=UPI000DC698B2|nr:uncharacterized protein LOC105249228 isoform X2 [Camponotus floridanus]
MGIMAVGHIILLSALFVQTLSAPSGCIESCNFYQTSYQNRRTSGSYQDHAPLVQGSTNLNNYDYARPGNWTEHNQYITDSGHGKVHEERGQYVEGSKRVRYYKQNFSSSYGTGNVDGELGGQHRYDSLHVPSQHLESQDTQLGQTVTKESGHSSLHSQQSSTRIGGKNERLEDFGEYGHSQHGANVQTSATTPENWSRVDSYKTDGGHGRVFEEEGQYVSGPKKVRYFKKNYTSSYSTSGDAEHSETLDKLHSGLHQNVQQELDKFRREFHHQTANIAGLTQEAAHSFHSNDLQTAESENTYGQQQISGFRRVPSVGTVRHYTDQQQTEAFADRQQSLYPSVNTYGTESQRSYQSHETHVSRAQPVLPSSHLSPSYPMQVTGGNYQSYSHLGGHQVGEIQREISGAHQSGVTQNRLLTEQVYNPNPTPNYNIYPGRRDESRHYQEEHWQSSSSHNAGNLAPEHGADFTLHGTGSRTHYDRDAYNEQRGRYHSTAHGYDSRIGSSYGSGYGTRSGQQLIAAESSLDPGRATHGADCTEETHQQYQHETSYHRKYKRDDHHVQQDQEFEQDSEQLDLTQANNQQSEDFTQHDEDFTQQTEGQLEFGQQTVGNQHLEDLTQHDKQFTQQTEGQLEFGQQTVGNQHLEDLTQHDKQFTQQTEGQLEFGQQTVGNQHLEDLTQHDKQFTQQTEGQLEFGQQTVGNQHLEDSTHDKHFTQQTEGQLEFGQQTVGNQHLEDLTQHDKQFTQQTEGQLEFGQQTVGNQHLEDLTQQDKQFTQQTEGQFEFGQQTVGNQHLEDLTQQDKQFTQQTEGQFEFGQQTVGNQHLEDSTHDKHFTQQTEGQLEFGQQTVGNQHLEDLTQQDKQFTQQTGGQFEFDQQTVGNQHLEDLTQQDKQFTQQTEDQQFTHQTHGFGFGPQLGVELTQPESNDRTQQTDKLEFGQQTVGNEHLEDLTQQDKQFTQETEGQLEFGQQTLSDQSHLTQHSDQLQPEYDDLTQQTSGKLEFGQQIVGNQHLENQKHQIEQFETPGSDDYTQQTSGKLEFGHQTADNQHLEDVTIFDKSQSINKPPNPKNQHLEEFNNEDFSQQTGEHDFTQQTMGQLEFAQQDSNNPKISHHSGDFIQSNKNLNQQVGEFDDFTQQGHFEYGQQRDQSQKPSWPGYNTQHSEHLSQQNDWTTDDLSQQSHQYPSYGNDNNNEQSKWQLDMSQKTQQDFTQQTNDDRQFVKPAPKPKPRPRQRHQKYNSIPSHMDGTDTNLDDIFEPIEINPEAEIDNLQGKTAQHSSRLTHFTSGHRRSDIPHDQSQGSSVFDNEKENMDRLHWVHKSNDATVGLQWHYTYHPSDLTNIESSHNNYYPHHNVNSQQTEDTQQQQSKPFDFSQQETQNKDTFENIDVFQPSQTQHDKHDQQVGSFQQAETSHFDDQFNQNSEETPLRVKPLQNSQQTSTQTTEQTEHKIESRILEAYGGGPYASRNDDIYRRVKPNPSATLPPIGGEDPWDIREKPKEIIPWTVADTLPTVSTSNVRAATTEASENTTQIIESTTTPSFWSRVGHKITSTYDKAKETYDKARGKAKEYFG